MFVLYICLLVAGGNGHCERKDYVPRGDFTSQKNCVAAARKMGRLNNTEFFCTQK
jgi:hypothetical protein